MFCENSLNCLPGDFYEISGFVQSLNEKKCVSYIWSVAIMSDILTLLHSKWPTLNRVLAILSEMVLRLGIV